jgi:Ser/Thr protein kinase RdoA (MazF antagonist)
VEAEAIARRALERYDLGEEVGLELVRVGENATFRVDARRGAWALRVHRPGYRTPAMVRSEIAWMEALRATGIATPLAMRAVDGDVVQALEVAGEERLVSVLSWERGELLERVDDLGRWRELGALMGAVHAHGEAWTHPDGFERWAWDADGMVGERPHWGDPLGLEDWDDETRRLLVAARERVRARLAAFGTSADRYGLVHGDLAFGNVLVPGEGPPVLIDFDDCGCGWHLWELAVPLASCDGEPVFAPRRDALVDGYRSRRALPDDHLAELPTFVMARRLATLGWVLTHADTEHARRLRAWRIATFPDAARRYLASS